MHTATPIETLEVRAFTIPTEGGPESDGTLEWRETTLVLVEAGGGGARGIGWSYADVATARLIASKLAPIARGADALSPPAAWTKMRREIRNLGRPGIVSMALSAVDTALWDLKARLLALPLVTLLGPVRRAIPVYGSGGFCDYSDARLKEQLGGWAAEGFRMVKMKVGRRPEEDERRVHAAREAIGDRVELFVDANGAWTRKQALLFAERFAALGVRWLEEPVSSDDLEGLALLRDRAPAGMDVAAGEYGYDLPYFARMAGAVDALQADVTRCGGIGELAKVGALCEARGLRLSGHCAPALHLHAACAMPAMQHLEWFHDHARIERMLFDGVVAPADGRLAPDLTRPGNGLTLRRDEAARWETKV